MNNDIIFACLEILDGMGAILSSLFEMAWIGLLIEIVYKFVMNNVLLSSGYRLRRLVKSWRTLYRVQIRFW